MVAPAVVIVQVSSLPIVAHLVASSIADGIAAREVSVPIKRGPVRTTPIQSAFACIVTINKDTALPVLVMSVGFASASSLG